MTGLRCIDMFAGLGGFTEGARLPPRKRDAEHMLGNAVAPPVAEFLVRKVAEALGLNVEVEAM